MTAAQPPPGLMSAATALVDQLADAVAGSVVIEDDEPLRVAPELAAAAIRAPPWVRSFLSFENTIFLLAACLVLGGTLYVVATTWGRVPGRWQYLFLEGVILFYGSALMTAAVFLDRRLRLASAARFLGATCGITMIAAALVAGATFMQLVSAGLVGAGLCAVIGTAVAHALLRMTGARTVSSALFGAALLLLSAAGGLCSALRPEAAAILLVASVAVGGPAWLRVARTTTIPTLAVAIALPAATVLFPIAGWLPASFVGPALAAGGALATVAGGVLGGSALALALVALQAVAAGLAGTSIPALAAVALLGLPASLWLAMRAPPSAGDPAARSARPARQVAGLLAAALWIAVAMLWARAVGLIDGAHLDVQAWAWNGASALPLALAPLWLAAPGKEARGARAPGAEPIAWVIVLAALTMAIAPFPDLRLPSAAVGVASSALAYAWARRVGGRPRWLAAHVSALLAIWILARALWPAGALALAATGALALLLVPSAPAWIVGALSVPAAVLAAAVEGAPPLWLAALLAVYGATHLGRPGPPGSVPASASTRPLGPPALLAALGVALFYAGGANVSFTPPLSIERWPEVLAAALVPMAAFLAWRGGPPFLTAETMIGVGLAGLGGARLAALALACGLLLGRAPGAIAAAALALPPLLAMALVAYAGPIPCAALLAAAGAILAARPLPTPSPLQRIRWLAAPALGAAPLVLVFQASPGTTRMARPPALAGGGRGGAAPVHRGDRAAKRSRLPAHRGARGGRGPGGGRARRRLRRDGGDPPGDARGYRRARRARVWARGRAARRPTARAAGRRTALPHGLGARSPAGAGGGGADDRPAAALARRDRRRRGRAGAGGGVAAPGGARDGGVGARGRAACRLVGAGLDREALLDGRAARTNPPRAGERHGAVRDGDRARRAAPGRGVDQVLARLQLDPAGAGGRHDPGDRRRDRRAERSRRRAGADRPRVGGRARRRGRVRAPGRLALLLRRDRARRRLRVPARANHLARCVLRAGMA